MENILNLLPAIEKLKSASKLPEPMTTSQQLTNWEAMTNAEKNAWIAESNRIKCAGRKHNPAAFAPTVIATGRDDSKLVIDGTHYKTIKA